ncbi:hypothetical protein GSY74_04090 [Sulfurovum sp. bin170]|uniref:hypothetical protein n=1 Tax=Sulfurovum sp. bin170 TaxID=2695268 RepID=UPI0013DE7BA7|nr:hypothetical protein [Sulfurovum sp. bin170]NEW60454.1 hypothetical protein [Sulfurovum sp. bin170]
MKTIKPILIIFTFLTIIVTLFISLSSKQQMVTIFEGNIAKEPIPIVLNHFQDSDCGMVIDAIEYASQVIAPNGKTWFFHDHGGMIKWLERTSFKESAVIWVYSLDNQKWIDGREAHYTRDEKTPMEYGFGAYKGKRTKRISFKEMQLFTLRGETMANPTIRKQLLKEKNGNH